MSRWIHREDARELPFAAVLAIEIVSIVYVVAYPEHWLRAVAGMTLGMVVAGVLRLVLSDDQVGLLRVRRRSTDVICYLLIGVLAITFGFTLHHR